MVVKLLLRWLITVIALVVAAWIVPGIHFEGTNGVIVFGVVAVILGVINVIIKPILTFFSCGCVMATLGLFLLVINAAMLWLSSWIAVNWFGIGFYVDGFLPALLGSIIVSVVSFFLSMFLDRKED